MTPISERVAATLRNVDWSRPNVVVWAHGFGPSPDFASGLKQNIEGAFAPGTASAVELDYDHTVDLFGGIEGGKQVLQGVIEGLRAHPGQRRIYLAGVSMGSWVVGDALGEKPALRQAVDGVSLISHIGLAKYRYPGKRDPLVHTFNDPKDRFSKPIRGGRELGLYTLKRLMSGAKFDAKMGVTIALNPLLFRDFSRWQKGDMSLPHMRPEPLIAKGIAALAERARQA